MPDRLLPKAWRITLYVIRVALYLAVLVCGVTGLIWTPRTLIGTVGEPLTLWWCALATIGALGGVTGVIWGAVRTSGYRVEWMFVWVAAGGMLGYAITVWGVVANGEPTRLPQASAVTGFFLAMIYRGVELIAHAAKLRTLPRR